MMNLRDVGRLDPISTVLGRLIEKKLPTINAREKGVMSNVAVEDFINYVMFRLGLDDLEDPEETTRYYIERMLDEDPVGIVGMAEEWIDVWLWKWKQRVKLVMKEDFEPQDALKIDGAVRGTLGKIKNYNEIRRFTVGSLIANNEVCFTNLLADNLIKAVLYKFVNLVGDSERLVRLVRENPLILTNEITSRVKNLRRFKGQLVVVKVSSHLFSEGSRRLVRDWWF